MEGEGLVVGRGEALLSLHLKPLSRQIESVLEASVTVLYP